MNDRNDIVEPHAPPGPPPPRARRGLVGRLFGLATRLVFAFALVSVLLVVAYRFVPPPFTLTMAGDAIAGNGVAKDWMPLGDMAPAMPRAAIAAEDGNFCRHHGFDLTAIHLALEHNAAGKRIRGGSTISQQTAKNVFLWQGRSYVRKAMEAWFTVLIEAIWGKRRIMEVYLNVAETGIGTYGANAGAQRYFHHGADRVSAGEAARIAAVLPLPKKRGAIAPRGFTARYGGLILRRMAIVQGSGLDRCLR